jgi:transposase
MVIPFMFAREEKTTMMVTKSREEGYQNKYRARRWVVERTHSWMNRFRRLLIRWEKKEDNYIAILHFVCEWMAYKREEFSDRLLVFI